MSTASSASVRIAAEWSLGVMAVISLIFTLEFVSPFNVTVPTFLLRLVPLYIVFVVYGCSDHRKIHALCFRCFSPITLTLAHLLRPRAPLKARRTSRGAASSSGHRVP